MQSDQHKQIYRLVFEHSMDAVLYTTSDGDILAANPAASSLFKYTESDICARGRDGLIDVNRSPQLTKMMEERSRTGETQGEVTLIRGDGTRFTAWFNSSLFTDETGKSRAVTLVRDLTQIKDKQISLNRSICELDDLYNNAPCGYHSIDADGLIVKMNQTELDWLGYERAEILGRHVRNIHSRASQCLLGRKIDHFIHHEPVRDMEIELLRKDGSILPALLNATAIYDDHGKFLMSRSTVIDLTQRKILESELKRQARTDFLTGLENRRYFTHLARREFAVSRRLKTPLGCLIIDLDHFKKINDGYGHDAGDVVLKALAECCRRTLREVDIVGRWGGEEFAVLLVGIMGTQVRDVAERIRIALSEIKIDIGQGRIVSFTVSIGASSTTGADPGFESMMKRADLALYSAKAAGRNRVMLNADGSA